MIIEFNPYRKKFKIEVYYDEDIMEVSSIKFPNVLKKMNGLSRADLLSDIEYEIEKFKNESMEDYYNAFHERKKNEQK